MTLHWYWAQISGNILAMPLEFAITIAVTLVFRKAVARAWHRLVGERADIEDIRRAASAAHKIAADLYLHHTGSAHPDAPGGGSGGV